MGAARILDVFERGLRLHDPEIGIAGGAACDDADGRTLGERSDRAERAHPDADIGATRDHRLLGFAGTLRARRLEFDAVSAIGSDAGSELPPSS